MGEVVLDPVNVLSALGVAAAVALVAAVLPAGVLSGGGSRRMRGIGPQDAVPAVALLVMAASVAVAVMAQTGPWHRASADHLRGRAFELVEREFLYRQEVQQATLALMRRAHGLELDALRTDHETQIASLRARYQDAWESLAQNSELLVRNTAVEFGLNPDFLAAIAARESGFDPFIANSMSGARGLFQFMPATWNEMGRVYDREIAETGLAYAPVTSENRGTDDDPRNNARLNAVLGAMLALYNIELTGSSDPAILYLAHFAGPEMARYVARNLDSQPDQPIRDVLRQIMPNLADAVIEQNAPAYTEDTTVADFYQWSAAQFAGIPDALSVPASP